MCTRQTPSRALFIILLLAASLLLRDGSARANGSAEAREQRNISAPLRQGSSAQTRLITYNYDAAGRLVSVGYGGGQGITYTYDANGNLLRREVNGGTTIYLPVLLKSR